ncbi:hypothetical protein [Deinococcus marmoris]|uniref:hypothetical protein n=1 Tax=Deinococcus marmoris TaxID=249408 RepID=UPI0004981D94|nr:hypothetical protein [Deinococcus marmoris]
MTPIPPLLGAWVPPGSPLTPPPDWTWRRPPPSWTLCLETRRNTYERAAILHDLGWAALLAGALADARALTEEGLALTRSQRAARPWQGALLVALSSVHRASGEGTQALARAEAAGELARARGDTLTASHAALAAGTVHRLQGERFKATRLHYLALARGEAHGLAPDIQALLSLLEPPASVETVREVHPDVAYRLALHAAAGVLSRGGEVPGLALSGSRFALLDELRSLPDLRDRLGTELPIAPARTAQVVTLGQPGLLVSGRFAPVYGQGQALALLAYLIERGSHPWRVVVDEVLGEGDERTLYDQLRYHLSVLRSVMGERDAVQLRRGRLSLSPTWVWSTDLSEPGVRPAGMPLAWAPGQASGATGG